MASSSYSIPQTSFGRLVSLTVDNPKYYTQPAACGVVNSTPPPPLMPVSALANNSGNKNKTNNDDELTMIWRNIAILFSKYDNIESTVESQGDATKRCTDEIYQELQANQEESHNASTSFATLVKKIRKYVNKKCDKVRETVSYGAYSADNEVFDFVNKTRFELEAKNTKLETELGKVYEELEALNETYYRDYEMFMQRENELLAKLDAAVKMNETTNQRLTNIELALTRQIQQARTYADTHVAGDLREEFSSAICREVGLESKTSAQLVQTVNDELTDIITRSNEYHSMRYFGMVEDVARLGETCQTLKQSIGMVDAELTDTKETIEHMKDETGQNTTDIDNIEEELLKIKDDIYFEMDRDYRDLKSYVKRTMTRHKRVHHHEEPAVQEEEQAQQQEQSIDDVENNAIQIIVEEYADPNPQQEPQSQPQEYHEHVIIIDGNMTSSDDEDYNNFTHT
jgi:HPt (histidine-containing phosphotransfer) domain-containing protein